MSLSILNYTTIASAVHDEIIYSSLPLLQENLYAEIQRDLSPSLNVASVMASDAFLVRWAMDGESEPERVVEYLRRIRDQYGYLSVFFVSDGTGNYYHNDGLTKQVKRNDPHDIWYFDFIGSGASYALDVDTNEAYDDQLTIFVNYRLEDFSGNLLGVTGIGIAMDNFAGFLRSRQEKYRRDIYLVDTNGLIQAHSNTELIENRSLLEIPGLREIASDLLRKGPTPTDGEYMRGRSKILVSSRYLPEVNWFLIVEQDETAALKSARTNLLRTILLGLAVSTLIIILSALTMTRFDIQMEILASTDPLTGTANRRAFDRYLNDFLNRSKRHHSPVSLIVFDIDHFKSINDQSGHQEGDRILKTVSSIVQNAIRPTDVLTRWGGDEFAILIENTCAEAQLLSVRLQKAIDGSESKTIPITISIGIAQYQEDETPESLMRRADLALYRSKEDGRNRITLALPDPA